MVERAGLENRCTASRYRGFESHLLRFVSRYMNVLCDESRVRNAALVISAWLAEPAAVPPDLSHRVAFGRMSA